MRPLFRRERTEGTAPRTEVLAVAEQVELATRPHVKVLTGPLAVLVVLAPTATYLAGRLPAGDAQTPLRLIVAGVALTLLVPLTGLPFWQWLRTTFVLTDRRLLVRQGLRGEVSHAVELSRVSGSSAARPGPVNRLMRCGTLVVDSHAEGRRLLLHDVPEVREVQQALRRLVRPGP